MIETATAEDRAEALFHEAVEAYREALDNRGALRGDIPADRMLKIHAQLTEHAKAIASLSREYGGNMWDTSDVIISTARWHQTREETS